MNPDEVIAFVIWFAETCAGGESYWIDPDGGHHSADMGYALDFLDGLKEYIDSVGGFEKFVEKVRNTNHDTE